MAWIESHTTMRTNQKLIDLSNELNISRPAAIGHLHLLWWWTIDNREDGNLKGLFDKDIANACDWDADPKMLIDALHKCGWLVDYAINDWEEYSWRLLNNRKNNRERQKKYRLEHSVTRDVTRYVTPLPNHTLPNHTKEKNSNNGRFTPPTIEETIEYFTKTLKSSEERAIKFFEFYGSKGWMVGKNKMSNWHLAASRSLEWAAPAPAPKSQKFKDLMDDTRYK